MYSPQQVLEKAINELEASIANERKHLEAYIQQKTTELAATQKVVERLRDELANIAPGANSKVDLRKHSKSYWIREHAVELLRASGGRLNRIELIAVLADRAAGSSDPEQLIRRALSRDSRLVSRGDSYELTKES